MTRLLIAAALLACWSSAAAAKTACLPSHGTDAYYQYRVIDGRKCWYRGAERLEKSALAWRPNSNPATSPKQTGSLPWHSDHAAKLTTASAQAQRLKAPMEASDGGTARRDGHPSPDFDATFAHFPAYEVARPVVHLLYPKNVAQAWGAKRVAVVLYRRPE